MPIYSQNDIEKNILEEENEVQYNGNTCKYNDIYDERLVIDMPFFGEKKSNTNAQGWLRDAKYYYDQLIIKCPECLSPVNLSRIQSGDYMNVEVDGYFIKCFPEYTAFLGDKLRHHHIGEDGQAAAIPLSIHSSGHGQIHNIEMQNGVTAKAKENTLKCKECMESGFIQPGKNGDIWTTFTDPKGHVTTKFEYVIKLKSLDELLMDFPEWSEYSNDLQKMFELKQLEYSTRETRSLIDSGEATIEQFLEIKSQPEFSEYISGKKLETNAELRQKYSFLDDSTPEDVYDKIRYNEYRLNKAHDTGASNYFMFDPNAKVLDIVEMISNAVEAEEKYYISYKDITSLRKLELSGKNVPELGIDFSTGNIIKSFGSDSEMISAFAEIAEKIDASELSEYIMYAQLDEQLRSLGFATENIESLKGFEKFYSELKEIESIKNRLSPKYQNNAKLWSKLYEKYIEIPVKSNATCLETGEVIGETVFNPAGTGKVLNTVKKIEKVDKVLTKIGKAGKVIGPVVIAIDAGFTVRNAYETYKETGDMDAAIDVVGTWGYGVAGGLAGSELALAAFNATGIPEVVATVAPPFGLLAAGALEIVVGIGGYFLGDKLGEFYYDSFVDGHFVENWKIGWGIISEWFKEKADQIADTAEGFNLVHSLYTKLFGQEFEAASHAAPPCDPLAIDLDGDGKIVLLSLEDGVNFDLDNNEYNEKTAWIGKEDGFLVYDRNGNNIIDNGGEMFGDHILNPDDIDGGFFTDGFEILKYYDEDSNGIIDENDSIYSMLQIWQDSNSNGKTDDGELVSLKQRKIISIDLNVSESEIVDPNTGTIISKTSTAEIIRNGKISETDISEFWFMADKADTTQGNTVTIGNVPNIATAIEKDETGELSNLYTSFCYADNISEMRYNLKKILYFITDANDISASSRGGNVDARDLKVIETFTGREFYGVSGKNPNSQAAIILKQLYSDIENYYFNRLFFEAHRNLFSGIILNSPDGGYEYDLTLLEAKIDILLSSGFNCDKIVYSVGNLLDEIDRTNDKSSVFEEFKMFCLEKSSHYADVLSSPNSDSTIVGTVENDTLFGTNSNDYIFGDDGNDDINGGAGNDKIFGGSGDDKLNGGAGDDKYYFDEYHENDIIHDTQGLNKVILSDSLNSDDYTIAVDGKLGFVVKNRITGETIALPDFLTNPEAYDFEFEDGSKSLIGNEEREIVYSSEEGGEIEAGDGFNIFYGGSGDDTMLGGENMDFMYGGAGNDTLHGRNGVNVLFGEDGNDKLYCGDHGSYMNGGADDDELYGGGGNDVLDGGTGDDYLQGDHGDDSYIFRRGYGHDTISESSGNNTVLIYGYSAGQMVNTRNAENDLIIGFRDSEDTLTIKRFFDFNSNRDFNFEFENGTVIGQHDMPVHYSLITGTDENNYLNGTDRNDIIDGGLGNDSLNGFGGEDTYIFGKGYGEDMINEWGSDHSFVDLKDINSDEITVSDQWGSNLLISVNDSEDVLTVSNFRWGQASYTFRFADGAEGYVDKNTWELVLTKQPEIKEEPATEKLIPEEETADETDTLVAESAEILESLYAEDGTEEFSTSDTSELIVTDAADITEDSEEVFDQTDIQVMILTENMAAFGGDNNVFNNTSFADTNDDTSLIDQMLVNSVSQ